MKKYRFFISLFLFLPLPFFAQTVDIKDGSSNTLLQINDEGLVGSIFLPQSTTPFPSPNKLYNLNGTLMWNGSALGTSTLAGGWTSTTGKIYNTTLTDKVGIGTSNPFGVLSLRTKDNWNPSVGDGWGDFNISDGTKGLAIGMAEFGGGAGDIRIWAKGGTERIMIGDVTNGDVLTTVDGKVGIGASSPEATLDIRSSGIDVGAQIQIGNFDRTHTLTLFPGRQNDPNPFLSWIDADALRFVTFSDSVFNGFSELMRIESSGNVGIGVEDPDAKLEVNGQVKITGGTPGDGKVLTSDAEGLASWQNNKIGFYATLNNDLTPASFTETQLQDFTETFDDGTGFNTTTGVYTIPADGVYHFILKVQWSASATLNSIPIIMRLKKNGNTFQQLTSKVDITTSFGEDKIVTGIVSAVQGDDIIFTLLYSSGTPLTINAGTGSAKTNVAGFKIY